MLNMNKSNCQIINGSVSERSLWAEKMSATHKPARCSTHSLFHNWELMNEEERLNARSRGMSHRFQGYVEITPGKWILQDMKPSKKKSDD